MPSSDGAIMLKREISRLGFEPQNRAKTAGYNGSSRGRPTVKLPETDTPIIADL